MGDVVFQTFQPGQRTKGSPAHNQARCTSGCPAKKTKPDPKACPLCYGTGTVPRPFPYTFEASCAARAAEEYSSTGHTVSAWLRDMHGRTREFVLKPKQKYFLCPTSDNSKVPV